MFRQFEGMRTMVAALRPGYCSCACTVLVPAWFTYWVDIEIPLRTWRVKVNDHFLIRQVKLPERDVSPVSVGATVIGVECDLHHA